MFRRGRELVLLNPLVTLFLYRSARFGGGLPHAGESDHARKRIREVHGEWGMAEVDPLSRDADIDIGALFASLRRHWLFIVVGALLMAALAWAVCLLLTPDYRAEARIMIEARESIYTAAVAQNRPLWPKCPATSPPSGRPSAPPTPNMELMSPMPNAARSRGRCALRIA